MRCLSNNDTKMRIKLANGRNENLSHNATCAAPLFAPTLRPMALNKHHILLAVSVLFALPQTATAHASNQSLVLLLPTAHYIWAGAATVLATVLLAGVMSHQSLTRLFSPRTGASLPHSRTMLTSLASTVLLFWFVTLGLFGPTDPLANLMTLTFWVVVWVILVLLTGVFGNLWAWVNPWTGLFRLLGGSQNSAPFTLPNRIGHSPAIIGFLAFSAFGIADPAASDPIKLATLAALYWMFTFMMMMLFGAKAWLERGEFFSLFFHLIAKLSPLKRDGSLQIGFPGWRIASTPTPSLSLALFSLLLLGTGTFDGLNETFFWLAQIGVNPLEFPGRSAIVPQTIAGYLATNITLVALFYACVRLGCSPKDAPSLFARQSLTILPIALAYHYAHFLPTLLVDSQYTLKTLNDPYQNGADVLGLGQFYVTTGFFNTTRTVSIIFASQVCAIVLGHVLSILLSHRVAADFFTTKRQILRSQIPLSAFMIGYTILGLWLLATAKGA